LPSPCSLRFSQSLLSLLAQKQRRAKPFRRRQEHLGNSTIPRQNDFGTFTEAYNIGKLVPWRCRGPQATAGQDFEFQEGFVQYKVEKIEGVGAKFATKLAAAGIRNTKQLLDRAATRKGRAELAKATGVEERLILKWANMSDLMRIKGVGEEFSELLEIAGVDTVKELAKRRADNLRAAMVEANGKRKLVRQLPSLKQCENWVTQAKTIDPVMSY
jgi:predicted flap endonuclease-1-like 5' DNA nuclease